MNLKLDIDQRTYGIMVSVKFFFSLFISVLDQCFSSEDFMLPLLEEVLYSSWTKFSPQKAEVYFEMYLNNFSQLTSLLTSGKVKASLMASDISSMFHGLTMMAPFKDWAAPANSLRIREPFVSSWQAMYS